MLKIIILEDDTAFSRRLTDYLGRYAAARDGLSLSIQSYDNAVDFLTDYRCDADLLLMDIQMPGMLGIDAAKKVREIDTRVMIIFITTLTQYAIEGYSVGAFDYILKPLRFDILCAKLDRAMRILSHMRTEISVEIRSKKEVHRVHADDIRYIEVSSHDVLVHTDHGTFQQWGNLKAFEDLLSGAHFARCNACYLVNLKYVRAIIDNEVDVGGELLSISKLKRREFLNALAQFKGGSR